MKAVDVSAEIIINRPVSEVAAYTSEPGHATEWYANIKIVRWITPRPLKVGSQISFTAFFLGRKLVYTYEVVEWIPNEKFVMRTADGPFPMQTTYTWTKVSDKQTRMKLQNTGMPSGFSSIFAPFMAMAMRRENQKDLKRLKKVLESKSGKSAQDVA